MTGLAGLRRRDLLTVGFNPCAISPIQRRTVCDSQLPTTADDAEWTPSDDIALTVKYSKFFESNTVQPTVYDRPLMDTIPAKSSHSVEALYRKGSKPSVMQQEHKGRSASSCSVCGLQFHELSDEAAVQHVHNCLYGQLDTNQVAGDDNDHQDRETENNQNESMDRSVDPCFVGTCRWKA